MLVQQKEGLRNMLPGRCFACQCSLKRALLEAGGSAHADLSLGAWHNIGVPANSEAPQVGFEQEWLVPARTGARSGMPAVGD